MLSHNTASQVPMLKLVVIIMAFALHGMRVPYPKNEEGWDICGVQWYDRGHIFCTSMASFDLLSRHVVFKF